MLYRQLVNMFKDNRLSNWLPYMAYDKENQVYVNSDSTFGFLLECAPTLFAGEQLISGLTSLLQQEFPRDTLIQFLIYGDPNTTGIIEGYSKIRDRLLDVGNPREEYMHTWVRWQAEYMLKHRSQGISREVPVPFRNFRSFISVKIPCTRADAEGRSSKALDHLRILKEAFAGTRGLLLGK